MFTSLDLKFRWLTYLTSYLAHWLALRSTKGAPLGIQCQGKNIPGPHSFTGSGGLPTKMTAHFYISVFFWSYDLPFLWYCSISSLKLHLNSSPFHVPLPPLSPLSSAFKRSPGTWKKATMLGVWTWLETHGLTAWVPLFQSLQAFFITPSRGLGVGSTQEQWSLHKWLL